MRKFWRKQDADMNMILSAIIMAVVFAVGIIIVFNVLGAVGDDLTTLDGELAEAVGMTVPGGGNEAGAYNNTSVASNATASLQENVETFYTVGPIMLIVVAAVGILSYVLLLRRK